MNTTASISSLFHQPHILSCLKAMQPKFLNLNGLQMRHWVNDNLVYCRPTAVQSGVHISESSVFFSTDFCLSYGSMKYKAYFKSQ